MKEYQILIITAHRTPDNTTRYVFLNFHCTCTKGVDQKFVWTWSKIAHCFVIHIGTTLRILKKQMIETCI